MNLSTITLMKVLKSYNLTKTLLHGFESLLLKFLKRTLENCFKSPMMKKIKMKGKAKMLIQMHKRRQK